MILLIDNYDSFTYNLYQYMGIFREDIEVVRNDKITIEEICKMAPEKIVLSPGPKSPKEAGICLDVVKEFYAKQLYHGKQSLIHHTGTGIFDGIESPIRVARYHSLAVSADNLPDCLEVLATTEDGEIMAMQHKKYPVIGLQFHPESVYTEHGKRMMENFLSQFTSVEKNEK